jgi:hypothetical protein
MAMMPWLMVEVGVGLVLTWMATMSGWYVDGNDAADDGGGKV